MFSDEQIEQIVELLSTLSNTTKLYIGCDSIRKKHTDGNWYATYATVLVIHMDGRRGCRIFHVKDTVRDYDQKKNKPSQRLMGEVQRAVTLYHQLHPFIDEFDVEIHLDISSDSRYGSSCVAEQATGYVLGTTGIEPHLKPESWASSFGADGIGRGFHERTPKDKFRRKSR